MLNPYLKLFYRPKQWAKLRGKLRTSPIAAFYDIDSNYVSHLLISKSPEFWEKKGEEMALSLFRDASARIPAYKDFLKKNKIKPEKIKTIGDFKQLPIIDKANYLKQYPLESLCWDGKIESNTLFSVSSGSSGTPFFWPRGDELEIEHSIESLMYLKDIFKADIKTTLLTNSFSMGIYIAGLINTNSTLRTSELYNKG